MDKKIINNVLRNTATEQDAVAVAEWLGEAEGQLAAADRIDADMEMMVPYFDTPLCAAHVRVNNKVNQWWRVAAVVAMVLTLAVSALWLMPKMRQTEVVMQTVCANRGEQKEVVLQDGTHIYLNAGSYMSFPSRFTKAHREVSLVGEAYFEVEKNEHQPFVVELNGVSVEVLGTKFNVKAYENEPVRVNLDEGHVQFHSDKQQVDMQAGESLCYDRSTCNAIICRNADTHMASAWREHRLEVSDMPMQKLITILERQYDVNIHIRDTQCYDYMYSMVVSDRSLRSVLRRMSYVSPILYYYDEEKGDIQIRARK